MNTLDCFKIWIGIKAHFTSEYDYIKYQGKISVSVEALEKRNDKTIFTRLAKKYTETEFTNLLIFNFIDGKISWIGDVTSEEAQAIYVKHQKIIDSMTYVFKKECDELFANVSNPNEIIMVNSGNYPLLLTKYLHGEISIESICILNNIVNFMDMWNKKITDTIQWPDLYRKITKFSCFFPTDVIKFKNILKEVLQKTNK